MFYDPGCIIIALGDQKFFAPGENKSGQGQKTFEATKKAVPPAALLFLWPFYFQLESFGFLVFS